MVIHISLLNLKVKRITMPENKSGRPPLKRDSYYRDYYAKNRLKFRDYAKNSREKKKLKKTFKPLPPKDAFNYSDLMQMTPEQLSATIERILKKEFILTGDKL